jgi:hypothetical protein
MNDPLVNVRGPLDGAKVRGGCQDCDAYQTVRAVSVGLWDMTVHHDDCCSALSAMTTRAK